MKSQGILKSILSGNPGVVFNNGADQLAYSCIVLFNQLSCHCSVVSSPLTLCLVESINKVNL